MEVIQLWKDWPVILAGWRKARKRLLILDFDGTIVPIVKHPFAVRIPERAVRALTALCRERGTRVAVISGRSLRDLRKRLKVRGLLLIGNHGLESSGSKAPLPLEAKLAKTWLRRVKILIAKMRHTLRFVPGVFIEDKGWTLSIHYRGVSVWRRPAFEAAIHFIKASSYCRNGRWRRGKMVWEYEPDILWDKGRAAELLVSRYGPDQVLVVGDDVTDESMFRRLAGKAVTVRAGRSTASAARYHLAFQSDVQVVLEDLAACRGRKRSHA